MSDDRHGKTRVDHGDSPFVLESAVRVHLELEIRGRLQSHVPAVDVQGLLHPLIVIVAVMTMPIGRDVAPDSQVILEFEVMGIIDAVGTAPEIDRDAIGFLVGKRSQYSVAMGHVVWLLYISPP
jgi:hypothetical protein